MRDKPAFTIEKKCVRLSLQTLTSKDCLSYSMRHYFSTLVKHASQHPLMYQIDSNPDCISLAICAERFPISHCFFHYKENTDKKKVVALHNFMVMPQLRGKGIGSLLAIHLFRLLLSDKLEELIIEIDFSTEGIPLGFASKLFQELIAQKGLALDAMGIRDWMIETDYEDKALTRQILRNLIMDPECSEGLYRKECVIGVISDNDVFFDAIWDHTWPSYTLLKPIHLKVSQEIEKNMGQFNFLIIDSFSSKSHPSLLNNLTKTNPWLPVVVVGEFAPFGGPSVLFTEKMPQLMNKFSAYLLPYNPKNRMKHSVHIKPNLLHLPESGHIINYKNLHRGKRLFIIASGPSLSGIDPALFSKEITMTLNDALVKFPKTRYASIMDSRKLHELHQELLDVKVLFTLKGNSFGVEINLIGPEGLSLDLGEGIYSGYTVAYFSLQIAIYMGFKEVYYVGLDLGNTTKKSHFFGTRPLQNRDRPEVYAQMRRSFEKASARIKELGLKVYNCSPVSELKTFPFRLLHEVLG